MKKLILLLIINFSTNAYADCSPKDLTDPNYMKSIGKENLIKHFQSPRNQDGVGWCGAYSPSDSLSFAVGEPVSALDISINYYASKYRNRKDAKLDELGGILPQFTPDMAEGYGYCPEDVLPSNQTSSSNLGQKAILNLLETFQQIYDDFVEKGRPADFCLDCIEGYVKVIKPSIPNATSDLIKNILQKNQGDSLTAFKDMLNKLCEGRRVKINTQIQIIHKDKLINKSVASVVDEALENNSMPSFGMNTSYFANINSVPGGHGPHEMMIVAKRMNSNGVCEYLVRNSWGKGCSYYLPHIAEKCDDAKGSFWMDQNQLQAGVIDLLIIKNEKNLPMSVEANRPDTQNTSGTSNTQNSASISNAKPDIILTSTQNKQNPTETKNASSNSNTQNAQIISNTQNTPSISDTQDIPVFTTSQNLPTIVDKENTENTVDTQTTTSTSDLSQSADKVEQVEPIDQLEKTSVKEVRKFSIFNIFKRKSHTDNNDINSKPNVGDDANKDLPKTTQPKESVIKKFSNFFSSIWKSLSKAFKY